MADDELTPVQKTFIARAAIVVVVGAYQTDDGDALDTIDLTAVSDDELVALGINQDVIDGFRLAVEDLEKVRTVMEEQAAFNHLMAEMTAQFPNTEKSQLQKSVRALVADPDTRAQAAEASGVYLRMGFEPVEPVVKS